MSWNRVNPVPGELTMILGKRLEKLNLSFNKKKKKEKIFSCKKFRNLSQTEDKPRSKPFTIINILAGTSLNLQINSVANISCFCFNYRIHVLMKSTVKPLITSTSKEFIKCRILHFLIMKCCRYLVFLIKWLYRSL